MILFWVIVLLWVLFWNQIELKEGNGTPLQYSCLENPMDRGAWKAAVHGVAESRTRLSDFTLTFHLHALEKEMATHFSVHAWRIPEMAEPGGLPSVGSHRVEHYWSDLAAAAELIVARREYANWLVYFLLYAFLPFFFFLMRDLNQQCPFQDHSSATHKNIHF